MSAPAGWYDAGTPGRQRWWDGRAWTDGEREMPAAGRPMGWYAVEGTADVRWWDGTTWTPYRIRGGRPKPDVIAVEPAQSGLVLGIVFGALALVQLASGLRSGDLWATGLFVLFLAVAGVWLAGSVHTTRLRKQPPPQGAPVVDPAVLPLPGDVEGAAVAESMPAGWYPMTARVSRWWTGARWSWYIGMTYGVRPGHAGPRGYLASMIVGWVLVGVAVAGVVFAGFGSALLPPIEAGLLIAMGVVLAIFCGAGGIAVLLITRTRRAAMIPPLTPPTR